MMVMDLAPIGLGATVRICSLDSKARDPVVSADMMDVYGMWKQSTARWRCQHGVDTYIVDWWCGLLDGRTSTVPLACERPTLNR